MRSLYHNLARDMFAVAVHALKEMGATAEEIYDGGIDALTELYPPLPEKGESDGSQKPGADDPGNV